MSSEKVYEDDVFAIEDGDFYEISLVPVGSQTGDKGFIIQKMDNSSKQEGDESVTKEENTVKVDNLSDEDKKELFNDLNKQFDVEQQAEMVLENEELAEKITNEMTEDETDKEEKSITPKSREALKTVLDKLSKVKDEMPTNYMWVYKAIAELIDETAPEFEKSEKEFSLELNNDVRETIKQSVKEIPEDETVIKNALESMLIEKDDEEPETEELSKTAKDEIKKVKTEVEKVKKEKEEIEKQKRELEKEKIKKELTERAESLENIPENTEKMTEMFAELYNLDENVLNKVENLLKKIDKQKEMGALFEEKGHQKQINKNETAQEKLDRLVDEKLEKGEADNQAKAMTEVLDENEELYEQL